MGLRLIFTWFDASEAAKIGVALADQFARQELVSSNTTNKKSTRMGSDDGLQEVLQGADRDVRSLQLNFYKKAKFANSFKWRLLENGVDKAVADEVTQRLILHLSGNQGSSTLGSGFDAGETDRPRSRDGKHLLTQGNRAIARGAYSEAIDFYEELIRLDPRHAAALNNLGAALSHLNRFKEAEGYFFRAIKVEPNYSDPHSNIGIAFLVRGLYADAESFLRRALKLNPRLVEARINLGLTLALSSRLREAKSQFEKALKYEPRNVDVFVGMALVAKTEGRFEEANTLLSRALQINPKMPKAMASQAGMRKMTSSDNAWLERAEEIAASGIAALHESELRFAIGKYYDDVGNYSRAFQNYERANDLLKPIAEPYDREAYENFVDILIRAKMGEAASVGDGASASMKPIFVVGMPRSGTSLTEQITCSHPSAYGAGELMFWSEAVHEHEAAIQAGPFSDVTRNKLAASYLQILDAKSGGSLRVVDKAPVNSDYLGIIHSVFPNARFIYMRRDPIDTCLSCYFQKFVLSLNFTMDLSDLAHYYRQHERLIGHWRKVLPPGTILDVPYEGLVADQEGWTRKILDFLGLEWDKRVLDFHKTNREVATASFWQVRQKIYNDSVQRWRNYEKYIGPLLDLKSR
jgi:tetratricopeptide (TPR) repeat protein